LLISNVSLMPRQSSVAWIVNEQPPIAVLSDPLIHLGERPANARQSRLSTPSVAMPSGPQDPTLYVLPYED
jgi:hypothetical protein